MSEPNKPGRTTYVNYVWHDGTASTFCLKNPIHRNFIGDSGPQFSFIVPGSGWRHEDQLNFLGLDNKRWYTKAKAEHVIINPSLPASWHISFSSGIIGMNDQEGDMPIIIDPVGKYWRVINPSYAPGQQYTTVELVEYNIPA